MEVGALRTISPALDIVDGPMVIMAPKRVIDSESQVPRWQNTVVTSGKERFSLSDEELLKRGWYAPTLERSDIRVAKERYSTEAINGFLHGGLSGDLRKTYRISAMRSGRTLTSATIGLTISLPVGLSALISSRYSAIILMSTSRGQRAPVNLSVCTCSALCATTLRLPVL